MSVSVGIGLAFVAMLSWGIGDFWIQKSARKVGDLEALFFITFFGAFVLAPFAYPRLWEFMNAPAQTLLVVGVLCVTLLIAAFLDFEALRVGKLAVVEPIWSFEVPVAGLIAFFLLGERIGGIAIALIVFLLLGLALVSLKGNFKLHRFIFEKGILIAFLGAVMMGAANFFMGLSSRLSDPIMANFISDVFIALVTGCMIIYQGGVGKTLRDIRGNLPVLLQMSVADKAAWVAFAFAMVAAPISIAVALSESYIVIAVLLGLAVNRERLDIHQKIGLVVAVGAAVALAVITG
ncbi:MAG: DMT family transporter [Candidatus Taylorbacteria bacterium]|nr:DMT family transporter [Candidatus Taylorbacteria bacterium]